VDFGAPEARSAAATAAVGALARAGGGIVPVRCGGGIVPVRCDPGGCAAPGLERLDVGSGKSGSGAGATVTATPSRCDVGTTATATADGRIAGGGIVPELPERTAGGGVEAAPVRREEGGSAISLIVTAVRAEIGASSDGSLGGALLRDRNVNDGTVGRRDRGPEKRVLGSVPPERDELGAPSAP
jgi:hypothetical protein